MLVAIDIQHGLQVTAGAGNGDNQQADDRIESDQSAYHIELCTCQWVVLNDDCMS